MQADKVVENTDSPRLSRRDPFASPEVSKNLRKSSVRGASVMSMSRVANMGLRFIATGILARMLAPGDFGLVAMTAVISGFFAMFMDVGLTQATIQRPEITRPQISTLFWINVALGCSIALVVFLIAPLVAAFYKEPRVADITRVLALTFVIGGIGVQHQALLSRNMRFAVLASVDVASVLLGIVVGVTMATQGYGYWALVGMTVMIAVVKTAGVWIALRWLPGLPQRGHGVKDMLRFGGDVFGFSIVNYFSRQADNVLIGRFCGASPLALYEKAYVLLLMPVSQINGPLSSVTVPALSRLQKEPDRFSRFYLNAVQVVCSIGIPMVMGIALFADQVVLLWLGSDWAESASMFRLLAVAAAIGGISNPVGWLLISLGLTRRYRLLGIANSSIIVLAFVMGLLFGPEKGDTGYSMKGVAIAYSIAMAVNFIPFWWLAVRGTPVTLISVLKTMLAPVAACVPAAGIVLLTKHFIGEQANEWLPTIALGLAFGLIYGAVLLFGFKKLDFFKRIAGEFRSRK